MDYPLLSLAWRNLWRNTRRTLITCSAVGLGLAVMVFVTGWARGLNRQVISTITRSGLGDAQIHAVGYRETGEPELVIKNPGLLVARADSTPGVTAASPRVLGEGLLAMGGRSKQVKLIGVDPEREKKVTDWGDTFVSGGYLGGPSTVVIGRGLAKTLEVETGARLVMTVADIHTGELRYRLLTVAGIIISNNPLMDKHTALLNREELAQDMGVGDAVHEIALSVAVDRNDVARLAEVIAPLNAPGLAVDQWQKISPLIARMSDVQIFFMSVALLVIFFLISFGIVNTMSMSLLERFREFGILRALGTTPFRLWALIIIEAGWLGAVGTTGGLSLGLAVLFYFATHGIYLGGAEAIGISFQTPVYPIFYPPGIVMVTLAFLFLTPAAALLVAWRAARIDPATALRSE